MPVDPFPSILYEDNHLLVVNKPAGALSQGDKTGDAPLSEAVKDYLKAKYDKPGDVFLGLPHRLDRPTSGVLIFARTGKALERMNLLFRERKIRKTYWAIVKNLPDPPSGILRDYLIKDEKLNRSFVRNTPAGGAMEAVLEYRLIATAGRYFLLEINPLTGRHHQIRVQLSRAGWPIKGDLKYGSGRSNPGGSISLHARRVEFIHPIKKIPLEICAPVPGEKLWRVLENKEQGRNNPSGNHCG